MQPNIEITDKNRQEAANVLNMLLADEFVLNTKTRNAHWNITGSNFMELHKFFESQYQALDEIVDSVAERVRTLGHCSLGSLKDFLEITRIGEEEELSAEKDALQALLESHEAIIRITRKDIVTVGEKYKDLGTADFITGILKKHETMAWMLRSYLS